jgi:hypothetical protein
MLKELLNDHQLFHSEFQQDYFITGLSGKTLWGMYKQSLRELYKRTRGLRESYCDREKLEVEIEQQYEIANKKKDYYKAKFAAIEYKRKTMQLEELNRVIKDTEREFKRFYQQALSLKEKLGELTEDKKKELEEETQIFKIKEMICIDLRTRGMLSNVSYERINAVPYKIKKKILDDISSGNILKWYEDREDIPLDYNKKVNICLNVSKEVKKIN